ncbi:MAG: hypothetical protein ACRDPD_29125 [Streptosporangiaceae bacterium]
MARSGSPKGLAAVTAITAAVAPWIITGSSCAPSPVPLIQCQCSAIRSTMPQAACTARAAGTRRLARYRCIRRAGRQRVRDAGPGAVAPVPAGGRRALAAVMGSAPG